MGNAQMSKKVVYWQDRNGALYMGLPEQFPTPFGMEKIVCVNAMQAEFWSKRMRQQERVREAAKDDEREMVEGPIKKNLRSHIQHLMANAKDNKNREFLRLHLEKYEKRPDLTKSKRVSYLHIEGFEQGH